MGVSQFFHGHLCLCNPRQPTVMKLILLLSAVVGVALSHPNFSSNQQQLCQQMSPFHGPPAQTSQSPYNLYVIPAGVGPPGTLNVTLWSQTSDFKGFFMNVRGANQAIVPGDWIGANSDRIFCAGNADTVWHGSPSKYDPSQWNTQRFIAFQFVPRGPAPQQALVRATVVMNKNTFWQGLQSPLTNTV